MAVAEINSIPIREMGKPQGLPRAAPADPRGGCPRPLCNDELNSRVGLPLPPGEWKLKWQAPLSESPHALIVVGDRAIVPQGAFWEMFDENGKRLATESLGDGPVVADPDNSLFYTPVRSGYVVARRLFDGKQAFAAGGAGPDHALRYLARRGSRLITLSTERPPSAASRAKPRFSSLMAQDLGDTTKVDRDGILTSSSTVAEVEIESLTVPFAIHKDTAVHAAVDQITIAGLDLQPRARLTGKFTPMSLSLDEQGRLHLIVNAEDRPALWVIAPDGQRIFSYDIPAPHPLTFPPPVIGHNHTVHILTREQIFAVDQTGKPLWQAKASALAGAVITADDQLLGCDARELVAIDQAGERRLLFTAPSALATAPVLTGRGQILIATATHLLCLSAGD